MFGKKTADTSLPAQLPGRNDPCHCGSGKKYKKCCEAKDEAKRHTVLEKNWEKSEKDFEKLKKEAQEKAAAAGATPANAPVPHSKPGAETPQAKKRSFLPSFKFSMPRKTGGGG